MNETNPYLNYLEQQKNLNQSAVPSYEPEISLLEKVKMPLFLMGAIIVLGVGVAVGVNALFSSSNSGDPVVIKAERTAFKDIPDNIGGMDIPNADSEVFAIMRDGKVGDPKVVENLLAQQQEEQKAIDKLEAFAQEAEQIMAEKDAQNEQAVSVQNSKVEEKSNELVLKPVETKIVKQETKKIPPQELLAQAERSSKKALEQKKQEAVVQPKKIHPAGSSPETLAFVRSVLDKKDGDALGVGTKQVQNNIDKQAVKLSQIEPTSGAALPAGDYYIQLGSVRSETGAEKEWGKFQKSYPRLSGAKHRFERADLADRGTFYRIQAGPMAKDSADQICSSIKVTKPQGCLVVR